MQRRRRRNAVKPPPTPSSVKSTTVPASASNGKRYASVDHHEEMDQVSLRSVNSADVSHSHQRQLAIPRRELAIQTFDQQLTIHGERCPYVEKTRMDEPEYSSDINPRTLLTLFTDGKEEDYGRDTDAGGEHGVGASALALGIPPKSGQIEELYPTQGHFATLWHVYLQNVQPVTMILHPASTGMILKEAAKGPGIATRDAEVLLFAVMTCALKSITEEECTKLVGLKRSTLIARYQLGCELALVNVGFLMSRKFDVLQAYMVYLSAVSADLDPRELWSLTGIAKRNAQRLSLHQEERFEDLTPFEIEMRRRLWHQIVIHDTMTAQIASLQESDPSAMYELKLPSNINDGDLSISMMKPPKQRIGATDMIFCSLRGKLVIFMGRANEWRRKWCIPREKQSTAVYQSCRIERQRIIEAMEKDVELEILRYCDILKPVHVLTASVARLALCKLHYSMLEASRSGGESSSSHMAEDRDNMFSTALRILEYENNVLSQSSIRGFLWHTRQDFQWSCLILVLQVIKAQPSGEQADNAWQQIGKLYEYYGGQEPRLALHLHTTVEMGTLDAWRAREIHASQHGQVLATPLYITSLQGQKRQYLGSTERPLSPQLHNPPVLSQSSRYQGHGELTDVPDFHHDMINWSEPSFSQSPIYQADGELPHPTEFEQDTVDWTKWPNFDMSYADTTGADFLSAFDPKTTTSTQTYSNIDSLSRSTLEL